MPKYYNSFSRGYYDKNAIKKLETELWDAADSLRAESKLTSAQYCMPVLGLIFLRYAFGRFNMVKAQIKKEHPSRPDRPYVITEKNFQSKSAIYLDEQARYANLLNLSGDVASHNWHNTEGTLITSLGMAVNNAMTLIENRSEALRGVLPKNYTDFSDSLLSSLMMNFNNDALDDVGGDVLGRIYEYFLGKFAKSVASDDGVFFTPKSLVKMIVNVLEPRKGTLLDPACGSGGMFVQTGDFVNREGFSANAAMTFFGQEKAEFNAKICAMNMAVHGLSGKIKSGNDANTFYHDAHNLAGKCDYVMANPPFNVDKVNSETALAAGRLPFGLPGVNKKTKEVGNANYLWISYFYSYLKENKGRAGFVMASSATDSQGRDREIRQQLVESGDVDVIMSVANNFFYTVSLPCSLWFFDKGKAADIKDKVLFIDARNYFTVIDRKTNEWTEWQLKNLNAIVWLYRGETEKYVALLDEYREALRDFAKETADDTVRSILLNTEDFSEIITRLREEQEKYRNIAKEEVAAAPERKNRKKDAPQVKTKKEVEAEWNEKINWFDEVIETATQANWLVEKFGKGIYADVLGLCKIAGRNEIAEKNYSLTPGAYVGVKPEEDDGVDFAERMKEIHAELLALQKESNELMEAIITNLKGTIL